MIKGVYYMERLKLHINAKSKPLPSEFELSKIYDLTANGIEILPLDEDFPMPWDAGCYIEDSMFIIEGSAASAAPNTDAIVRLPLLHVDKYLELSVYPMSNEADEELRSVFTEYGWM